MLKHVLVHSIRADEALKDLGVATKFVSSWEFLTELRDRGRETAERWACGELQAHRQALQR